MLHNRLYDIILSRTQVSSIVLIVPEAEDYEVHFQNYKFFSNRILRFATNLEKQQLFDALAKKGKRWNSETKTLEDLPKKYKFEAFDMVLVRNTSVWRANFFSHYNTDSIYQYCCVKGSWKFCLPYNEQTAHLLGTTDDYEEGGEE